MIILGPDTHDEQLEIILWTIGSGPQTPAVRRFIVRRLMTREAAYVTRNTENFYNAKDS